MDDDTLILLAGLAAAYFILRGGRRSHDREVVADYLERGSETYQQAMAQIAARKAAGEQGPFFVPAKLGVRDQAHVGAV